MIAKKDAQFLQQQFSTAEMFSHLGEDDTAIVPLEEAAHYASKRQLDQLEVALLIEKTTLTTNLKSIFYNQWSQTARSGKNTRLAYA